MCLARARCVPIFRAPASIDAAGRVEYRSSAKMGVMKTIQLRRYTLVDGEYDAFLAWWNEWMPRVRPAAGFTIEFAYGLRETNEFVWAVSAEGDRERFTELEQAYLVSDARTAAFDGVPQRIAVYNISFVDDVAIG